MKAGLYLSPGASISGLSAVQVCVYEVQERISRSKSQVKVYMDLKEKGHAEALGEKVPCELSGCLEKTAGIFVVPLNTLA